MPAVMTSLNLSRFCRRYSIRLIWVSMLGPDGEDFDHAQAAVQEGNLDPADLLMVMNHGVLRGGNPDTAFLPIMQKRAFRDLIDKGARSIIMPNLYVMKDMREAMVDFYEVAAGTKPNGELHQPVWSEMSNCFLDDIEDEFRQVELSELLPCDFENLANLQEARDAKEVRDLLGPVDINEVGSGFDL